MRTTTLEATPFTHMGMYKYMCGWEGRGLETAWAPTQTLPPHAEGRVLRLGNQFNCAIWLPILQ